MELFRAQEAARRKDISVVNKIPQQARIASITDRGGLTITFEPPPNDPYGITTEALVGSLEGAFVGTRALISQVVPFLMEQIEESA